MEIIKRTTSCDEFECRYSGLVWGVIVIHLGNLVDRYRLFIDADSQEPVLSSI